MRKLTKARKILIYGCITILYFILSLPFLQFRFPDGFSQLRLTGMIPAAAGLMFGLPGALSCAVGNLLGDIAVDLSVYSVFGFLGNFLAGWIPYKLWHLLSADCGGTVRYLDSPGSILKFTFVSAAGACSYAGVIGAGGQILGGFTFRRFFAPVALQYYALSVLGGMLIVHVCTSLLHLRPYIPDKAYTGSGRRSGAVYALCAMQFFLVVVLFVITGDIYQGAGKSALSLVYIGLTAVLALFPFDRAGRNADEIPVYQEVTGLKSQVITIFLSTLCGFFVFFASMCFRLLYVDFRSSTLGAGELSTVWMRVIVIAAVAATVFILVLALVLKVLQRKVLAPLGMTAEYAEAFVGGGELKRQELCFQECGNELDILGRAINHMARDIRRYVEDIRLRTAKEERIAVQLDIAKTIQLGLLPGRFSGKGFTIAPFICPAREVGGDLYYFHQQEEDRVFVCIADVSGKDISAAMFMTRTRTLLEAYAHLAPGEMLKRMNNALADGNEAMMFVTLFAAVIDRKAHIMSYANAGHNAPVYYDRGATAWLPGDGDLPLGVMADEDYQEHVLEITESFQLFIYTDGVNEAQNGAGDFFGDDRILAVSEESFGAGANSPDIIRNMEEALGEFVRGAEQADDITMLALSLD